MTNAYDVILRIFSVANVTHSSIYVLLYEQPQRITTLDSTQMDGLYSFDFPSNASGSLGIYTSAEQINSSGVTRLGFGIYSGMNPFASIDLSLQLVENFPNTSTFPADQLWPDVARNFTLIGRNLLVQYQVTYSGAIYNQDDGYGSWSPVVELLRDLMIAKIALSFGMAFIDWYFQPLIYVSTFEKILVLLGNFFWLCCGGFITGMLYVLTSIAFMCTIVFIPAGIKLFRYSVYALFPFGRSIEEEEQVNLSYICCSIVNVIWFIFVGFWMSLLHFVLGILFSVLIVSFPMGIQHFRMIEYAASPLVRRVVHRSDIARRYRCSRDGVF